MKVIITKPIRVNCLSGEVEVTEIEAERLAILGAIEPVIRDAKIDETKTVKRKKK